MTLTSRNGRLYITFYHQSKRYRKSLGLDDTKANRKLAQQKIIPELLYKLNSGEFFENEKPKVPTVGEFAKVSFEIHRHERREITQKDYIQRYECHIKPYFKSKRLDKIKPSDIAKWQNRLLDKVSGSTLAKVRKIFNIIFEDAVRDEIIEKNPFKLVKSPKIEEVREKRPFTLEEIFAILNAMPEHIRAFFATGFFTGMRTGELIGLKWEDIDWKEKVIQIKRSRRRGKDYLPKTKNSIREIDIIEPLMPYLQMHRELSRKKAIYVFETYENRPFNTCDKISAYYWKPTLKKLGIPHRNLYQMRHTFASLMIANGEDILWVSQMLGHKDSSMTLQKYARYIRSKKKKRATFISDFLISE
ncbi:site-specific integrase [Nitrosophilus alvini]|uniref:site-specific integrase n=1 Tax=Nitrosophilus alvini TaxID=2714855 RepID=UPI00190DF359|nr:site-specific integrase [Nitrosophilus alvini]